MSLFVRCYVNILKNKYPGRCLHELFRKTCALFYKICFLRHLSVTVIFVSIGNFFLHGQRERESLAYFIWEIILNFFSTFPIHNHVLFEKAILRILGNDWKCVRRISKITKNFRSLFPESTAKLSLQLSILQTCRFFRNNPDFRNTLFISNLPSERYFLSNF